MAGLSSLLSRIRSRTSVRPVSTNDRPRHARPETLVSGQSADLTALTQDAIAKLPDDLVARFRAAFDPSMVPEAAHGDETLLFSVHVPKTAGSALLYTLRDAFDDVRVLQFDRLDEDLERSWAAAVAARDKQAQPYRQVIMGHVPWKKISSHLKGPEAPGCFAFIRNPADRLVSNYNYNCSTSHPFHERFRKRFPDFESYVERTKPDAQLRQLVGTGPLPRQLERLLTYYRMIGVTEHMNASLLHMERCFGLPRVRQYVANVARSDSAGYVLTPEARRTLCERNMNDWILFSLLEPAMGLFADRQEATTGE